MDPEIARKAAELGKEFWIFIGFVGGFFWSVFLLDRMYKKAFSKFISEIHRQYTQVLNSFGLYKKPNGEWQKDEFDTPSPRREAKAYKRSDSET